jgi:hypothetical protein
MTAASFAAAQTSLSPTPASTIAAVGVSAELPNAPGSFISSSNDGADTSASPEDPQATQPTTHDPPNGRTKESAHLSYTIAPNEIAEPMDAHDKVVAGLKSSVSLFSATGWLASAGWEQLTNGSPNYGTDRGAFGQRLGASAIRNFTQDAFSDALFAPVFHEDHRYYIMGRGNNFFKRAIYAGTRVLITRNDSGHNTPNFALLAGTAASSALTVTYYPAKNTTFSEVAQTYGGSLGGSAVGYVVTEFLGDVLQWVHIKKAN